jgi:hypothetical protein
LLYIWIIATAAKLRENTIRYEINADPLRRAVGLKQKIKWKIATTDLQDLASSDAAARVEIAER